MRQLDSIASWRVSGKWIAFFASYSHAYHFHSLFIPPKLILLPPRVVCLLQVMYSLRVVSSFSRIRTDFAKSQLNTNLEASEHFEYFTSSFFVMEKVEIMHKIRSFLQVYWLSYLYMGHATSNCCFGLNVLNGTVCAWWERKHDVTHGRRTLWTALIVWVGGREKTRFYDCVIACRHVIYLAIRCMHSCGCMSSSSTCNSLSASELSGAELATTTIGAQRLPYVDLGGPPAIDEPIYLPYRPT